MKNSLFTKMIAIVLCAACLLGALASGVVLCFLGEAFGDRSYQEMVDDTTRSHLPVVAWELATCWASVELGAMPEEVAQAGWEAVRWRWLDESKLHVTIADEDGETLASFGDEDLEGQTLEYGFAQLRYEQYIAPGGIEGEPVKKALEGIEEPPELHWNSGWRQNYTASWKTIDGQITLYLTLAEDAVRPDDATVLLGQLSQHTKKIVAALIVSIALFAVLAVFLCSVAGCRRGTEKIQPGGFSALPLDLYGAGCFSLCGLLVLIFGEASAELENIAAIAALALGLGYAGCVMVVCFCFGFAAQVKVGGMYWLRHSVTGFCLRLCWKIVKWVWDLLPKCAALIWHLVKDCFKIAGALVRMILRFMKKLLRRGANTLKVIAKWLEACLSRLPLLWQWLTVGAFLALWLLIAVLSQSVALVVLWGIVALATVLYGADCFAQLLEGARQMRSGELESKVDGSKMVGCFREFSQELNGLADVAMVAAQKQLRSERMKTELITNVSHDIKTPLTSIINYVDLLEKPHTPQQAEEYVEVLSRQSRRLKKLIDDLMELSRASTGNIQVDIGRIDGVEAVTQALGEFSDKLEAAGLTLVFRSSEEEATLLADGRLLWRTISNVLSNTVKYAMPGTRFYVDVASVEEKVLISFKNISGAQLNVSAEELMERFVRGDSSRNTEGSGLGLNIAKSLMELQKGQLHLLVDGDLFKVTLVFPKAD